MIHVPKCNLRYVEMANGCELNKNSIDLSVQKTRKSIVFDNLVRCRRYSTVATPANLTSAVFICCRRSKPVIDLFLWSIVRTFKFPLKQRLRITQIVKLVCRRVLSSPVWDNSLLSHAWPFHVHCKLHDPNSIDKQVTYVMGISYLLICRMGSHAFQVEQRQVWQQVAQHS